ncbi:hypothetical protein VKT23_015895 [Stygiomarasmius scandens]|uniref:Uncharacterized protein n=1 Tax=Marasmiellus scandens TaxID=2682957 RepID=A0ABR1IWI0_9AGAR
MSKKDVPHCTTLSKAIKEKHQTLIQQDLEMIKLVQEALQGLWPIKTLTVHFIQPAKNDPTDWSLHTHLLTFNWYKGHHTRDKNGKHLVENIQKYEFTNHVGWFTSDGVSVNDKATHIACQILDSTGKTLKAKEHQTNCIKHTFNLLPSHFCQALQIPKIMSIAQHLHKSKQEYVKVSSITNGLGHWLVDDCIFPLCDIHINMRLR